MRAFALQNNADGGDVSSDFIPQNTAAVPTTSFLDAPNLGTNPDFHLVPGTQSAALTVGLPPA